MFRDFPFSFSFSFGFSSSFYMVEWNRLRIEDTSKWFMETKNDIQNFSSIH